MRVDCRPMKRGDILRVARRQVDLGCVDKLSDTYSVAALSERM